jgi:hypothetical protein
MTGQGNDRIESPAERLSARDRETIQTVLTSTASGVAATVMAVTMFSPAGFGGLVGESLASNFGSEQNLAAADDPYANLPAFPAPLTSEELSSIRGELSRTSAALEITKAATEARIERVRAIAMTDRGASFAPVPAEYATANIGGGLKVASNQPVVTLQPGLVPADYTGGGSASDYRASHNDIADLMFAHENF